MPRVSCFECLAAATCLLAETTSTEMHELPSSPSGVPPSLPGILGHHPPPFPHPLAGVEIIKLLVDYGADLDAITPKDWTPLSYCKAKGKYGATEEKGIYPEVRRSRWCKTAACGHVAAKDDTLPPSLPPGRHRP